MVDTRGPAVVKASRRQIKDARRIVAARDMDRCQMCGLRLFNQWRSVHHRKPKGMGGSALLESPANLVTLCGAGNADGPCARQREASSASARGSSTAPRVVSKSG